MPWLKNLLTIFAASLIFISCQTGATEPGQHPSAHPDSLVNKTPKKDTLSAERLHYYASEIKNFYENKLVKYGFNGGILVAKRGQVIFEDYHGYYDLRTKQPLDRHSAFQLASVSKTFTAMATLKLVEEGKLSLNDTLQKFFPKLPYPDIRVKDLLSHRSGLPNYLYFMDRLGWDTHQRCSNEDVLHYLIEYKPQGNGRPNTHFNYCNTNYALLALIIQKASGESYSDYLKHTFFDPLGMKDTYVFNIGRDSARAMRSYDARGRLERYTFLDEGFGDKNIFSTPEDLLKWDQALYTHKLFTADMLKKAYTPYSNEHPGVRNYGYGWRMNVYPDGRKVIYHNGWWHGSNTVFIRSIQDSVTIIVLGNKYNNRIYHSKKIAEFFEGGKAIEDE